jgi:hypothetical protein
VRHVRHGVRVGLRRASAATCREGEAMTCRANAIGHYGANPEAPSRDFRPNSS